MRASCALPISVRYRLFTTWEVHFSDLPNEFQGIVKCLANALQQILLVKLAL